MLFVHFLVLGQVRTVIGQARLLMCQRFKQFSGLVDDCAYNRGEKETTCTDLQGFWEMIDYQVEDVKEKFKQLKKLQEKQWKIEEVVTKKRKVIKVCCDNILCCFRSCFYEVQCDNT